MGAHTKAKKASNKKFYEDEERRWKRRTIPYHVYIYKFRDFIRIIYLYRDFVQVQSVSAKAMYIYVIRVCGRLSKIYQTLFVAHRCLWMNFACALDKFNLARHGYDTIRYDMMRCGTNVQWHWHNSHTIHACMHTMYKYIITNHYKHHRLIIKEEIEAERKVETKEFSCNIIRRKVNRFNTYTWIL